MSSDARVLACDKRTAARLLPFCPLRKRSRCLASKRRCLDLWEAAGHFHEHLGPDSAQPMPQPALLYLYVMRTRIAEELAFLPGSSLYQNLTNGGGGSSAAGDGRSHVMGVGLSVRLELA